MIVSKNCSWYNLVILVYVHKIATPQDVYLNFVVMSTAIQAMHQSKQCLLLGWVPPLCFWIGLPCQQLPDHVGGVGLGKAHHI